MAKPSAKRDTETSAPESINPIVILRGWWDAIILSAGALVSPPLKLCGIKIADLKKDELAQAVRAFPVIGLAVGLLAGAVYGIIIFLNLPPLIAAIIAVAIMTFLGGASSEAGLARMADAIIGGGTKTAQLAKMKDHTIGGYGTIVLVLTLGLRVAALATIAETSAVAAALGASVAASWGAIPALLHYLPPARKSGFSYLAGRPAWDQAVIAALLGAAFALLLLGFADGIIALAIGAIGAFKFAWLAKIKFGGTTGDILGAAQQGAEVGILLAITALI